MEYECFLLDPRYKLCHIEGTPLLSTNCLSEASGFIYDLWMKDGTEACIWQERTQGYRGYYRRSKIDGQPREKNGRFGKRANA